MTSCEIDRKMEITKSKKKTKSKTKIGNMKVQFQKNRREIQPLALNELLVFSERLISQLHAVRHQLT